MITTISSLRVFFHSENFSKWHGLLHRDCSLPPSWFYSVGTSVYKYHIWGNISRRPVIIFFCCETKNFMIPWTLCGGTMQKISQFFAQYLFTHLPCTILAQLSKNKTPFYVKSKAFLKKKTNPKARNISFLTIWKKYSILGSKNNE